MPLLKAREVWERRERRDEHNRHMWMVAETIVRERIADILRALETMRAADLPPRKCARWDSSETVAQVVISMGLCRDFFDRHGPGWFDRECAEYRDELTSNLVHLGRAWPDREHGTGEEFPQ